MYICICFYHRDNSLHLTNCYLCFSVYIATDAQASNNSIGLGVTGSIDDEIQMNKNKVMDIMAMFKSMPLNAMGREDIQDNIMKLVNS